MKKAARRCWWCGLLAVVDPGLPEDNGLIRDDSTFDGSESWVCIDNKACQERGLDGRSQR